MAPLKEPNVSPEEIITYLVNRYQAELRRVCFVYLKDAALAEDAVQEAFLKAYRNLGTYDRVTNERAWLIRIAVNTAKDMLRGSWFRHIDRHVRTEDLPEPAAPMSAEDRGLMEDILNLPAKLREVILLYYYENFSEQEIADALGIALGTVSTRLFRAKRSLRLALEGGERDE